MTTLIEITTRDRGRKVVIPKGTKVEIINWHGDVAIAEYSKTRFSVGKEHLQ